LADTRVSIRIGVDGAAEVKGALAEVGKAGDAAFAQVAAGSEKANAAIDKQAERYKRLAEAARASVAADRAQARVNDLLGVRQPAQGAARASASVFEEELKSRESLAARARALREAIDPTAAAFRRMSAAIAEADELLAAGAIRQDEHAAAASLAKNAYAQAEAGAKRFSGEMTRQAGAAGLARHELINLSRQAQDIGVSLAGGQSPLLVLIQQGSQIADVLGTHEGGLGAGIRALGTSIASLISPTVALGAAAASAAAIAYAGWSRWKEAQDALQLSLNGLGRQAGLTLIDVNRIAARAAAASGVSISSAQGLAGRFLAAGAPAGDSLGDAIGLTRDFSHRLGLSFDDAAKELGQSLADPARGAEELARKYGLLSFAQRRQIEELVAIGDRSGASAKLVANLREQIANMQDPTSKLARWFERAGAGFSDFLSRIGKAFEGPKSFSSVFDPLRRAQGEAQRLRADKAAEDVFGLVKTILPEDEQRRQLEQARAKFQRALDVPGVAGALEKAGVSGDTARHALENLTFQVEHWRSSIDKLREDATLAVREIEARTFAERSAVAEEKARLQILRETGDAARAAVAAEAERNKLIAEGNRRAEDMKRAADNAHELVGLTDYERAKKQVEQELRDFKEQFVPKEGGQIAPHVAPVASAFKRVGDEAEKLAERFGRLIPLSDWQSRASSLPIFARGGSMADAAAMIRKFEDFRSRAYWDANAWRVGFGSDTFTRADGSIGRVSRDTAVSLEDAERDLARRLREFDKVIERQIGAATFEGLSPAKRAALEDIAYNYGLLPSRILPALKSGDDAEIAQAIRALAEDNGGINRARRMAEADLFVSGGQSTAARVATEASATRLADIDYQFVDRKMKDVNAELDNQNRLLEAQKGALGQDNSVMQGTIEAQKLLNYYLSEHIPIAERLKEKIIEAGQAEAERVKREEEFARAQRRIVADLDMARDSVAGVLESVALAGAHGQSIAKALGQSLTQIGDNFIRQSVDTLTEDLLGAKGTTGTGLIGSVLGALGAPGLGGGSKVAQANITAGVVNLSGGAGAGGLLGGGSGLLGGLLDWAKGLFGFADGGVMTSQGPLPLHRYAGGGIANSPQLALFGEGRTPEAYVPLPDGRSIPVSIKSPIGIPEIVKMAAIGNRPSAVGFSPTAEARPPTARPQPIVNLHISTPDRRSFEASEAQLTSVLTRMLARGARYA
jgi:GH24 family phage-related lysozyme (muramidase)